MEKRGQSSTIFIVVAAAIALIILVVLIAIFTGRFGVFEKKLESCQGQCVPESQCRVLATEGDCPSEKNIITIPIPGGPFPSLVHISSPDTNVKKCCLITE